MSKINISGRVVYKDLGTGFWGIVDNSGKEWRPVNMPSSLQKDGLKVSVKAEPASEAFSVFMWGTSVKILDY